MIEPPEVITQIFRLLKAPRRDIIFSRENVAVHPPSNSGTERITGHLLVVQKRGSSDKRCFFVWAPSDLIEAAMGRQGLPEVMLQQYWYSVCFPLDELIGLKKSHPEIGPPSCTFVYNGGDECTFFFHFGGLYDLQKLLLRLTKLQVDPENKDIYLLPAHHIKGGSKESKSGWSLLSFGSKIKNAIVNQFVQPGVGVSSSTSSTSPHSTDSKTPTAAVGRSEHGREEEEPPLPGRTASEMGFEMVDFPQWHEEEPFFESIERGAPVSVQQWNNYFDEHGVIQDPKAVRAEIFRGGLEPAIRREAWKFLLGYYPWTSTLEERKKIREQKTQEYHIYKLQWTSITAEQERQFEKYRERKFRVEKDVTRTDRDIPFFSKEWGPNMIKLHDILVTYSFYNFDIGYCQGMSDLLAPILVIMEEEEDSFWCFAGLMKRTARNFLKNGSGIRTQLTQLATLLKALSPDLSHFLERQEASNFFFAFRWVIVWFKREFEFDSILRLWEVILTDHYTTHFHLFVCLAMLIIQKSALMSKGMSFDEMLQHMNQLSNTLDLDVNLRLAEALWKRYEVSVLSDHLLQCDEAQLNHPDFSFDFHKLLVQARLAAEEKSAEEARVRAAKKREKREQAFGAAGHVGKSSEDGGKSREDGGVGTGGGVGKKSSATLIDLEEDCPPVSKACNSVVSGAGHRPPSPGLYEAEDYPPSVQVFSRPTCVENFFLTGETAHSKSASTPVQTFTRTVGPVQGGINGDGDGQRPHSSASQVVEFDLEDIWAPPPPKTASWNPPAEPHLSVNGLPDRSRRGSKPRTQQSSLIDLDFP